MRRTVALERYARDGAFPPDDPTTNATLEAIASLFRGDAVGAGAVRPAERFDATLSVLTPASATH